VIAEHEIATREDALTMLAVAMRMKASAPPLTPDDRVSQDYETWLREMFPAYVTHGFADHHHLFWRWVWGLRSGVSPRPLVCLWPRGGAKSSSVEMACAALGARGVRKYILYVSGKQGQADDHVANVAGLLEMESVQKRYPSLGERKVGKYGNSQGWRRERIRTASGLTIDALGLDVAARGVKLDEARPDLIVFDDVDDTEDSVLLMVPKKIRNITQKLLPAGSSDVAVLFVQNLVHYESIAARLAGLASEPADFLHDRIVSGPLPALRGAEFKKQSDGTWKITRGTPIWEGQNRAICEQQVNRWGIRAFRSESQHERTPPIGQAFPEFDQSIHVVEPFDIPANWPRARAVDYGYAAPYCCLWGAKRPDGSVVIYRETYETGMTAPHQARQILTLSEGERYSKSVGDPSMWASQREGKKYKSVADQYKDAGVKLTEASNNRIAGWERVHDYLEYAEENPPNLTITSNCTNLIRTLPMLPRDPHKTEDVDTDAEDHAPDALRYLLMAFTKSRRFGAALGRAMTGGQPATPEQQRADRRQVRRMAGIKRGTGWS